MLEAPQIRYTQDNQTPVAEMAVRFDGLRVDDPPGQIKAVGWGSVAQDLQNRVVPGQRLVLEGRLRMNTVARPDGIKEKRAEITLSRFHPVGADAPAGSPASAMGSVRTAPSAPAPERTAAPAPQRRAPAPRAAAAQAPAPAAPASAPSATPTWNSGPLVPEPGGFEPPLDDDDIPF